MRIFKSKAWLAATAVPIMLLASANVWAAGPPDQQCDASSSSAWTTIIRTEPNFALQTFTPTQDRLSRVVLNVRGDGLGSIGLAIQQDGAFLYLMSSDMVTEPMGRGDVEFLFNDVELTPGERYSIFPIYSIGNASLGWYYKDDCYAGGAAWIGSTDKPYDFGFETYGFTYEDPGPVPTATPTPGETSTTPTPTSSLTVSESLVAPTLESVVKNNLRVDDFADGLAIENDDTLVLNGSGTVGSTVLLTFNGNTYSTTVDENGKWFLQLQIQELESGSYVIAGQTQVGNEVSTSADLVTLELTSVSAEEEAVADESNNNWKLWLYIGIPAIVVIIGGLLTYYLIKRKKMAKKATKASSVVKPEESKTVSKEKPIAEKTPTDTEK